MSEASLLIFSLQHPTESGEWFRRNAKELSELTEDCQIVSIVDERNSQVLAYERPAYLPITADSGGVANKIIEVDRSLETSQILRAEIRNHKPAYVVFAAEEEDFSAQDISSAILALEFFPNAVAATAQLMYRLPAILEDLDTYEAHQGDKYIHAGRSLARLLALRAISIPSLSNLVVRAAALGSDLPGDYEVKNAILFRRQLVSDLLLRGPLWAGKATVYAPQNKYREAADIIGYLNSLKFAFCNNIVEAADIEKILHNYSMEAKEAGLQLAELNFVERYIEQSVNSLKGAFGCEYLPKGEDLQMQKVSFLGKKTSKATSQDCYSGINRTTVEGPKTAFNFVIGINPNKCSMLERDQLFGLYNLLYTSGYEAKIFLMEKPKASTVFLARHAIEYAREEDINENTVCVISDTAEYDRLFCAKKVVWHFSRRRLLGVGDGESEALRYAYSRAVDPYFPILRLPVYDLAALTADVRERKDTTRTPKLYRLLLVSKGTVDRQMDRTAMLEISETWPDNESSFAELAQKSALLLSCDWMSARNEQARLAGIPVVLCGEQRWPNGDPMRPEEHVSKGMTYSVDGSILSNQLATLAQETLLYRADYEESAGAVANTIGGFIAAVNKYYANSNSSSGDGPQTTFADVVPGI